MGSPSKRTLPPSGRNWPHRQLNNVVLPAPLGPTSPKISPGITDRVTSCRAWTPPKRLEMVLASSSGPAPFAPSGTGGPRGGELGHGGRTGRGAGRRPWCGSTAALVVALEELGDAVHPARLLELDDA